MEDMNRTDLAFLVERRLDKYLSVMMNGLTLETKKKMSKVRKPQSKTLY
jgi:predicted peroxiredoxin